MFNSLNVKTSHLSQQNQNKANNCPGGVPGARPCRPSPSSSLPYQWQPGRSLLKDPRETRLIWKSDFQRALKLNCPVWHKSWSTFSAAQCVSDSPPWGQSRFQPWWLLSCGSEENQRCPGIVTLLLSLKDALEAGGFPCGISPPSIHLHGFKLTVQQETQSVWPSGYLLTELGKKPFIF